MKARIFLISLCSGPLLLAQNSNEVVLQLIEQPGVNEVDIDLDVSGIGASDGTATLTGIINARVNISPVTGKTDELTILSANAQSSDVVLEAGNFLANYEINATGIAFTLTTIKPPGIVDPDTGEFDASQYQATTTQGMVAGDATTIFTGSQNVSFNLGEDPFSGQGEGTGTIVVTPGRVEGRRFYYDLDVSLPVGLSDTAVIPDLPIEITTDFAFEGTIRAAGETFVEFPDYVQWANDQALSTESENDFDLQADTPNYFFYALGFDHDSAPANLFELVPGGIQLQTSGEIALDDLEIQWSDDLINWERVPGASMIRGSSELTFGDAIADGPTVALSETKRYLRLVRPTQP